MSNYHYFSNFFLWIFLTPTSAVEVIESIPSASVRPSFLVCETYVAHHLVSTGLRVHHRPALYTRCTSDVMTSCDVTVWRHDVMWRHSMTSWRHVTSQDDVRRHHRMTSWRQVTSQNVMTSNNVSRAKQPWNICGRCVNDGAFSLQEWLLYIACIPYYMYYQPGMPIFTWYFIRNL